MVKRRVTELHTTPHQHLTNSAPPVVALVCGVSGSKSIHLTVTYPTRRAWMAADAAVRGGR